MKFRIDSKQLAEAVQLATKATSPKSTLPVLHNICLIALNQDELYLVGSDLETSLKIEIRAEVLEPGSVTTPAKDLLDYLKNFGAGAVIDFSVDRWKSIITYKDTTVELDGIVADEFPPGVVNPKSDTSRSYKINAEELLDGLEFTLPCVSTDETREELQGPRFFLRDGTFSMAAADGFRMALWHYDKHHDDTRTQVALPFKSTDLLKKLLKGQDGMVDVTFRWKEPEKDEKFPYRPECSFGWVHQTKNTTMVATLFAVPVESNSLSLCQFIPVKFGPALVLNRKDVLDFIKFAQPVFRAGSRGMMVVADGQHAFLGAHAECFSAVRRKIRATCSYPGLFAWGGKAQLVQEILNSYRTDKVQLSFPIKRTGPTTINAMEEPDRFHILMGFYYDATDYVRVGLCNQTPDLDVPGLAE